MTTDYAWHAESSSNESSEKWIYKKRPTFTRKDQHAQKETNMHKKRPPKSVDSAC